MTHHPRDPHSPPSEREQQYHAGQRMMCHVCTMYKNGQFDAVTLIDVLILFVSDKCCFVLLASYLESECKSTNVAPLNSLHVFSCLLEATEVIPGENYLVAFPFISVFGEYTPRSTQPRFCLLHQASVLDKVV